MCCYALANVSVSAFKGTVADMVDLIVSRICPNLSTSNSNGAIGPIHDTIKLTEYHMGQKK